MKAGDKLAAVYEILAALGFTDPESAADPAKAVKALAESLAAEEQACAALRTAIDKAIPIDWRHEPQQTDKDTQRIARLLPAAGA